MKTIKTSKNGKATIKWGCTDVFHFNSKTGSDTVCFRFSTAHNCRSRARGLCPIAAKRAAGEITKDCYDLKFERMRTHVKRAHENMAAYAATVKTTELVRDFGAFRAGRSLLRFRFNVGGDFTSTRDINNLRALALYNPDLRFYGYTATDLPGVASLERLPNVVVLRSGVDFIAVPKGTKIVGRGNRKCKGDCTKCHYCPAFKRGIDKPIRVVEH